MDTKTATAITESDRDAAQLIYDAADEGGIIQAFEMAQIATDPRMHTAMEMWHVADKLGPGVHAALAELLEYDPDDQ